MSLYYSTRNLLQDALLVTSTSADVNLPLANLYDGHPARPFRFNANAADLVVTADLNRLLNGDMETGTLTSWTDGDTGTGVSTKDLVTFHGGVASMSLNGGAAGVGLRYQDITAYAGQRRKHSAWMYGGGGATVRARILDLKTGLYLQAGGASWGAAADWITYAVAAWAEQTITYQVANLAAHGGQHETTLRITYYVSDNATGYVDDAADFPGVNFLSIHGHNLSPVVVPQMRSSTDAFGGVDTLEATLTIIRPSFYGYLSSAVYRRYWRPKLSGTNDEIPLLGEAWLGYAETIARAQDPGWTQGEESVQNRIESAAGDVSVVRLSLDGRRRITLPFRQFTQADRLELRDAIWRRSGAGEEPLVIVPHSGYAEPIHGRCEKLYDEAMKEANLFGAKLTVTEDGFPTVGL